MISYFSKFDSKSPIVFIAHASYEYKRSVHISKLILEASSQMRGSAIIANSTTLSQDKEYKKSFEDLTKLSKYSYFSTSIIKNRSQLIDMLFDLKQYLDNISISSDDIFLVDISTFPKDRLWVTLDLIANIFPHNRMCIGYTEPKIYNTEESADGWLSKGVSEVTSIPGFNGRQDPNKPSLLIMNIGHENERITITINNREPQKIIVLSQSNNQHNAISHSTAKRILSKLQDNYGSIVAEDYFYQIGSNDFVSIRDSIDNIVDIFKNDYNISVAMFGTKIQSIGAFLSCRNNRRIEAIYAKPQLYNRERYSHDIGNCWIANLYH